MTDFQTPAEKFLEGLISIPSVTGREGLIKDHLKEAFEGIGLDVELQHVDTDRYNVVGRLGEGPIRLMLCIHTDVMPAPDEELWSSPPFSAAVKGGRIYGRGAADAKGPLAAAMEALLRLKRQGFNGSVALAAVVEEETGRSVGARKLMEAYRPNMGVILEPTGLRMATAHKGAIRAAITVRGKAAHSSIADIGVNAISMAVEALKDLDAYRSQVMKTEDPALGKASLEVTMIRGGARINVVPEMCRAYVDRRLVRGEAVESSLQELAQVVKRTAARTGTDMDTELLCAYPPSEADEGSGVARLVASALERLGLPGTAAGFPAGCDMWAFVAKGIPTVILGPGNIRQAHAVDEYIDREGLRRGADVYEEILKRSVSP